MSFLLGAVLGASLAYSLCIWLYRSMQADDAWWQETETRRNERWPVTGESRSDG